MLRPWILLALAVAAGVVIIDLLDHAFPPSSPPYIVSIASALLVIGSGLASWTIRSRQRRQAAQSAASPGR